MLRNWIRTTLQLGSPIRAGGRTVTPYSRATTIAVPGAAAGVVWNRPGGVLVKEVDGVEFAHAVPDVTLRAQLTLYAMGLLGILLTWLVLRTRDRTDVPEEAK